MFLFTVHQVSKNGTKRTTLVLLRGQDACGMRDASAGLVKQPCDLHPVGVGQSEQALATVDVNSLHPPEEVLPGPPVEESHLAAGIPVDADTSSGNEVDIRVCQTAN